MSACSCGPIARKHDLPHSWPCPSYVKRKFDMMVEYRKADLPVYARHCPDCGRWASVLAGNDTVDDVYWIRTDCKGCGILEVEFEWDEMKGWIPNRVPVGTERSVE